jgi:hypothetical protein
MAIRIVTYANVASTLALVVALSGGAYAAGLVGTSQLKNRAVTAPKIATRAVTAKKIGAGAVVGGKLHGGAVTAGKIAPGAVGPSDLSQAVHDEIAAPHAGFTQVADDAIQQVGPSSVAIATITFPKAGTYLVTGDLRVFSRAANPGHSLFCSMTTVAPQVPPRLINTQVDAGVQDEPFVGTFTASAGQAANVTCRQGVGTGEITLTYDITAVQVS